MVAFYSLERYFYAEYTIIIQKKPMENIYNKTEGLKNNDKNKLKIQYFVVIV